MGKWLEKLRRWIDEDKDLSVAEEVLRDSGRAGRNKSKSELFLQKLLNEVETVLSREITRIPNSKKAYVPDKFVVFISSEKEKSLPKDKREFFEQFLSAQILESAREAAGQLEITAEKINVEVRVSLDLEEGEVKVETFSDEFDKTFEISLKKSFEWKTKSAEQKTIEDFATIGDDDFNFKPLYNIEIWRDGKMENEFPIVKREISIGRDHPESSAHIRLQTENRKISGLHTSISCNENGEILVTSLHKNPTVVAGKILTNGDVANLSENEQIAIYDFTLCLKLTNK